VRKGWSNLILIGRKLLSPMTNKAQCPPIGYARIMMAYVIIGLADLNDGTRMGGRGFTVFFFHLQRSVW
jgi:hypothetical protein